MVIVGVLAIGLLAFIKPYVRERIETFFNPAQGQQSQGYQIKQSLIAIGSGEFFGRGFGQGIQKFTYLPEPMGDSIFAVAGEELGFVGATAIVILFLGFAFAWIRRCGPTHQISSGGLPVGISTYLGCEARSLTSASMLGVTPLTGIPLTFVSQGGTAMLTPHSRAPASS